MAISKLQCTVILSVLAFTWGYKGTCSGDICPSEVDEKYMKEHCSLVTSRGTLTSYYQCPGILIAKYRDHCCVVPYAGLGKQCEYDFQCVTPNNMCTQSADEHQKTCTCIEPDYYADSDSAEGKCLKYVRRESKEICIRDSQCWKYYGDNSTCSDGGQCSTELQLERKSAFAWENWLVGTLGVILTAVVANFAYRRWKRRQEESRRRKAVPVPENGAFLQD